MEKRYLNRWLMLPLLLILMGSALFTGCGTGHASVESAVRMYYLDIDSTKLVWHDYVPQAEMTDKKAAVGELVSVLEAEPGNKNERRVLSADIVPTGFQVKGDTVTLDFPKSLLELSPTQSILIRAAVVKTLTQVSGIECVQFSVEGSAWKKYKADDFLESEEAAINTYITQSIVLYVTDQEGTALIPVRRSVTFCSGTPLEKVVMQQLILGTETPGFCSTIPKSTKLNSVTLVNGVCYVDLDESFRNDQGADVTEQVALYSIVNSLTELDGIDKVQISVNGDTTGKVRYNYDLNKLYRTNMDIVKYVDPDAEQND